LSEKGDETGKIAKNVIVIGSGMIGAA